jgi:hypothetical protein
MIGGRCRMKMTMWPFDAKKRRMKLAVTGCFGGMRHILISMFSERQRLISAMLCDPFVAGYVNCRVLGIAELHCNANSLESAKVSAIFEQSMRLFFDTEFDAVWMFTQNFRKETSSRNLFETGVRDAGLINNYLLGKADPRNHPMYEVAADLAAGAVAAGTDPTNIHYILSLEVVTFGRYIDERFPVHRQHAAPDDAGARLQ